MPRLVQVYNSDNPKAKPIQARYCDSFLRRLRGLTFRRNLDPDEGLLLAHGRDSRLDAAIHMLGVGFDIAAVWLDSDLRVVDKVLARRWRLAYIPQRPAKYVLEIHPKRWNDFEIGNKVRLTNV